jgi:competence protein ComEC
MKRKNFILILSLLAVLIIGGFLRNWRQPGFRAIFFDVGQGDASLYITPAGKTILIDGGPDDKVLSELGRVLPFWQRHLDLVILTHEHEDHLTGLVEISRRYQVDYFLFNKFDYQKAAAADLYRGFFDKKTHFLSANPGEVFSWDNGCSLTVLAADKRAALEANDYSIVTSFFCLGRKILSTGDAGVAIERELLKNPEILRSDILKVAHHGSASANSLDFLRAVHPQAAIVSVGKNNKFNLPAPIIMERLKQLPLKTYRTDEMGSLDFFANNKTINVKSF